MTRPERTENDARPGASGRASHQQETQDSRGSTLVSDTVAPATPRTSRIDPDTRGVQWTVVGLVGLVENMPDGRAQRPGDIVRSMKGDTIEVINTDAEGRLILADALALALKRTGQIVTKAV